MEEFLIIMEVDLSQVSSSGKLTEKKYYKKKLRFFYCYKEREYVSRSYRGKMNARKGKS